MRFVPVPHWEDLVVDYEYVHHVVRSNMPDLVGRAIAAGARPPLLYVGTGMTAVVLCDRQKHAFKIARQVPSPTVEDEAEWLETASTVPGVYEHVAPFIAYHPRLTVLERECPVPGTGDETYHWRRGHFLWDLHQSIRDRMEEHGWTAPEFKEDSYVFTAKGPILVDAGFAYRIGHRLLDYARDMLAGRRSLRKNESWSDLATDVHREIGITLTRDEALPVMHALEQRS
jgi:hypothetical protein